MILVAGGTGTLGRYLVPLLITCAHQVRVLTRDERRADHLRAGGAETVIGDVRDQAAVAQATRDCTTVVSAVHGFAGPGRASPASIDCDGNRTLIRGAADAGVARFVLVSVLGAAPDHPMTLHRMKYAAEQTLNGSGLDWTIIRPAAFLETWIELIGGRLADTGQAIVFGPGNNPVNFVSVRDVATVIERSLSGTVSYGQTIDVSGPENLTFNQIAERLVAAGGSPGRTKHIPLGLLRVMSVLARPVSPGFARQARAAVVMNTNDMTSGRHNTPGDPPPTTLDDVLRGLVKPPAG
ncbi:MAG: putative nucleoside diphosphate sugar epimerase [Actinomycetia bacterium]|nr:putative nucleoside diphosphate sugar epimerase [Actinomycetes bacterium]